MDVELDVGLDVELELRFIERLDVLEVVPFIVLIGLETGLIDFEPVLCVGAVPDVPTPPGPPGVGL